MEYPDFWSGIDYLVGELDSADQERLIQFLESLISNEEPGGVLKKVLSRSGAQVLIAAAKSKEFYIELLYHARDQKR
jgi:hypothetical protein